MTRNEKSWWKPGRWGMVLAVVGLAVAGSFLFRSPASAANLTADGTSATTFDPNGQNSVTVTVNGVPEGDCGGLECPSKSVVVTYRAGGNGAGNWGVSPGDAPPAHASDTDSSTTTSSDNNHTPPTTTTSAPTNNTGATDGQGNRTGNATQQKNSTKGMIDAAGDVYRNLTPPQPAKAGNITGFFTITVTWKENCAVGDGKCKYTVTLTVYLDNAGNPTGATAN